IAGHGDGGAILCTDGAKCSFYGNGTAEHDSIFIMRNNSASKGSGGGIACVKDAQCDIILSQCSKLIIQENTAKHGGGISVIDSKMRIQLKSESSSVEIHNNNAMNDGG